MSKRLFLLLIGMSLLPGCGFRLRGRYRLSARLSKISIVGEHRELVERLTTMLADSNVTVVAAGSATPTLSLSQVEFTREAASTDATGIATEFEYTWLVEFSVIDANGETLLPQSTVSMSNTLEYNPDDELGFREEEELLKKDMQEEVVLQIMRELARSRL